VLVQGEQSHEARVARDGAGWQVRLGEVQITAERRGGLWWLDGQRTSGAALVLGAGVSVFGAATVHFTIPDPLAVEASAGAMAGVVLAPMPGLVKSVFVTPGAVVEKGARLAILEAMKMEHTLTAGRDGTVASVLAKDGDQVEAGAALIVLEEE